MDTIGFGQDEDGNAIFDELLTALRNGNRRSDEAAADAAPTVEPVTVQAVFMLLETWTLLSSLLFSSRAACPGSRCA